VCACSARRVPATGLRVGLDLTPAAGCALVGLAASGLEQSWLEALTTQPRTLVVATVVKRTFMFRGGAGAMAVSRIKAAQTRCRPAKASASSDLVAETMVKAQDRRAEGATEVAPTRRSIVSWKPPYVGQTETSQNSRVSRSRSAASASRFTAAIHRRERCAKNSPSASSASRGGRTLQANSDREDAAA